MKQLAQKEAEVLPDVTESQGAAIADKAVEGMTCFEIAKLYGLPVGVVSKEVFGRVKDRAQFIEDVEKLRFKMHGAKHMWDVLNSEAAEDKDKISAYAALSKEYKEHRGGRAGVIVNVFDRIIRETKGKVIEAEHWPGLDSEEQDD